VYNFPDPPYILLVFGLFVGVTSGAAFEATLKQKANEWFRNRSTRTLAQMQGVQLLLPFVGISAGVCVFLAAGLEIFGLPGWLSYLVSLPLTIFIGVLVWAQLGQVLMQLERGGSKALDLDAFE
jgi:cobalamin biosynthesis protein CobD/CbiB